MTDATIFSALSAALQQNVSRAAPLVAGVGWGGRHHISGILWREGVVATSEQSLPDADEYTAILPGGARVRATLAGRDPATNVAVLRIAAGAVGFTEALPSGPGGLVQALGSDGAGGVTAMLGSLRAVGPAWESQRGGQIDRLIRVGGDLSHSAEGGPVIDPQGGVLGMSTFGPHGQILTIPSSTVTRAAEALLLHGHAMRGWLGAGLHPVALTPELAARAGVASGLMVVNLAEGAPAARALLPGDILLAIAGTPVATPRAAAAALGPQTVGQELTLTVLRGGSPLGVPVTIAARPA